jgi:hypothetical protein
MANKCGLDKIFAVFGAPIEYVFDLIDDLLANHEVV